MAGFPSRITRALFGPTREDLIPARDHVHFVASRFFNLLFWQVPGINVMVSRAGGLIVADALSQHEEAWHPNGGAAPTFSHPATGNYRLVYAATYKDADDNDVVPAITRARGFVQSATPVIVTAVVTSGVQVDLHLADAAGAAVDADVWFEAF
jgi:hypothetical protein